MKKSHASVIYQMHHLAAKLQQQSTMSMGCTHTHGFSSEMKKKSCSSNIDVGVDFELNECWLKPAQLDEFNKISAGFLSSSFCSFI